MTTPGPTIGLPRNLMRACILLLLRQAPSHGYELLEGLEELGMDRPDPGGLYRALRSMEQEDLVASWWEDSPAGPPRRSYALTALGEEALSSLADSIGKIMRTLQHFQHLHSGAQAR